MRNIKRAPVTTYSEISQTSNVKFSFVEDDEEQHSPVACRDFLNDAVYKSLTGTEGFLIYGFDSRLFDITTDKTRLLLTGPRDELLNVYWNYDYYWEDASKTLGISCEWVNDEDALYIEDTNVWLKAPWGISLLSHILRVFSYKMNYSQSIADNVLRLLPEACNEMNYAHSIGEARYKTLMENWKTLLNCVNEHSPMGYHLDNTDKYFIHNFSGIVSVFGKNTIKGNPNEYALMLDALQGLKGTKQCAA